VNPIDLKVRNLPLLGPAAIESIGSAVWYVLR